jgi:hypothetical protein
MRALYLPLEMAVGFAVLACGDVNWIGPQQ